MGRTLLDRVDKLERRAGIGRRLGLALLEELVVVDGDRQQDEVIAIEVGRCGDRRRFERRPGESLDELEARANPHGGWQAFPAPIFSDSHGGARA